MIGGTVTASDHLAIGQFGFKPHPDDPFPDFSGVSSTRRRISTDPSRYTTNQTRIDPKALEHYTKRGLSRNQGGSANSVVPVRIVKHGGNEQVWDGHHRLIAAHRRGQKTLFADYTDLDAAS